MGLAQWVLMILLALPAAYTDRNEENRHERMAVIADAITEVCVRATCEGAYEGPSCEPIWHRSHRELAALLVTKGWWESRFASHVHAGKCKKDECDAVKTQYGVIHLARSPWQLQRTSFSEDVWDHMLGDDLSSTRNAAWAAARVLAYGMDQCHTPRGALSWYGAQTCQWQGAGNRYRTYERLMAMPEKTPEK
jgi:hypothetical protein